MGWGSYQEDNLDAKGELVKHQVPSIVKSKVGKIEQTRTLKSQFKLQRSPNSTRGAQRHQSPKKQRNGVRGKKKQRNGVRRNTAAYSGKKKQRLAKKRRHLAKKKQRLTFDNVQQCLFAEKWRSPRKVSDWVEYVRAHFEGSNRELVPQVTLHRFVLLALCYLKRLGVMEEDSEGRWGNRVQKA